ncbi:hypothetical protein Q9189_008158 [Teloschistes chrysophthalmus]
MEREIQELRRQLAAQPSYTSSGPPSIKAAASDTASPRISSIPSQLEQYINSEQAVNSLIELRSGAKGAGQHPVRPNWRLEGITLSQDQVDELFHHYFTAFHPFVPLLEPTTTPAAYHKGHALLFWVVISVAARHYPPNPNLLPSLSSPISKLLWATLADVPQNYIVVKALCILCTWPLPISQTFHDLTFMLAGPMMQVAMQIGLYRLSYAQDFARFKVGFREEELKDRVKTVATGYGQPPSIVYDWTLVPSGASGGHYQLPREVQIRLDIERFCNKVTKSFYTNRMDPVSLVDDEQRSVMAGFLAHDFEEIESQFDEGTSNSPEYHSHLYSLWYATTAFLECVFHLYKIDGGLVPHASNYILQMIVAAGFTLLKLLNSFFADKINNARGRELFMKTIRAIRRISVAINDLPSRLAEELAQLWKSGGSGARNGHTPNTSIDNSLQLKVRCRMSMSLVHDSVWRWREAFQTKGPDKLEAAVKSPTNPDSTVESSASSTVNDSGLATTSHSIAITSGLPSEAFSAAGTASTMFDDPNESNYEVFDPQMWLLDGLGNFPFDESLLFSLLHSISYSSSSGDKKDERRNTPPVNAEAGGSGEHELHAVQLTPPDLPDHPDGLPEMDGSLAAAETDEWMQTGAMIHSKQRQNQKPDWITSSDAKFKKFSPDQRPLSTTHPALRDQQIDDSAAPSSYKDPTPPPRRPEELLRPVGKPSLPPRPGTHCLRHSCCTRVEQDVMGNALDVSYAYHDTMAFKRMIDDSDGDRDQKDRQRKMLRKVVQFCENTSDCRRVQVLDYFDEPFKAEDCHKTCDNCNSDSIFETQDFSKYAVHAINLVRKVEEERVTILHCVDILRGSKSKKMEQKGHGSLEEFGKGSKLERGNVERLFHHLLSEEALTEHHKVNRAGFPLEYVQLGKNSTEFSSAYESSSDDDYEPVHQAGLPQRSNKRNIGPPITSDEKLEALNPIHRTVVDEFMLEAGKESERIMMNKSLRAQPFTTTVLREMAINFPKDETEMLEFPGINGDKVRLYGKVFLNLVKRAQNFYESMMQQKEDRTEDPNHQNVINISDDDEFGNADMDDFDDQGSPRESSAYFASWEVQDFNAQLSQLQPLQPSRAAPAMSENKGKKSGGYRRGGRAGYRGRGAFKGARKTSNSSSRATDPGGPSKKKPSFSKSITSNSRPGGGGGGGIGMMPI